MRVLLVEDDVMFGKALARGLRDHNMTVDWVKNGTDGYAAIKESEHAIILLDVGLPGISGFEILKDVRGLGSSSPILIISARDGLDDLVRGLDLGADDYIVKPFELRALLARIRAVLRRLNGQGLSLLTSGEITLDPATHVATFRDMKEILSPKEYALLYALMKRPGTILSRAQIESAIYGWGEEVQSNAVDVLIHGLRKKFGKDVVRNVRGAGWMVTRHSA
jgi:DNA-binding response OmpR family regulator